MENKEKELKKPEEKAEEAVGGEKKLNDEELEQVAGGVWDTSHLHIR